MENRVGRIRMSKMLSTMNGQVKRLDDDMNDWNVGLIEPAEQSC